MHTRKIPRLRHVDLDDGDAFVPDFRHGFVVVKDGDAEAFGEEFIAGATSAEGVGEAARDELIDEDLAGLTIDTIETPYDELS
jgi:hypothetical protein